MLPILYSNFSSYYSMIARLILAEKNVKYKLHNIDIHVKLEQFSPEYVKIQPNMTVPTLKHGEAIFDGSRKILFFVNKQFPGQNLFPAEDATAIQKSLDLHYDFSIEDLTMGTAMRKSPLARFALNRGLNRAAKRCENLQWEHPEFKDACQNKLQLEEDRKRLILSAENNYDLMYQKAIKICDILEQQLSHQEFAASNSYSLADVVWTVFLGRLCMIKLDEFITSREHLNAYWYKMTERSSYTMANLCTTMPKSMFIKMILASLF